MRVGTRQASSAAAAAAAPPDPAAYDLYVDAATANLTLSGSDITKYISAGAAAHNILKTGGGTANTQVAAVLDGSPVSRGAGSDDNWYNSSAGENLSDIIGETAGGMIFVYYPTTTATQNILIDGNTANRFSVRVLDVTGTPTVRAIFGSGGSAITIDRPVTLNAWNFITLRWTDVGGLTRAKLQVDNGTESTVDSASGQPLGGVIGIRYTLLGGAGEKVAKGDTLVVCSRKAYLSDADVTDIKASFKAANPSLSI